MQADDVSAISLTDYYIDLGIAEYDLIVNIALLVSTMAYVWLTYQLWRTALGNQKEIISNQNKIANLDQYFTLRRIWRNREFISSRNRARRCWDQLEKPFLVEMNIYIDDNVHKDNAGWEDFSLTAHFMTDVFIEHERGHITAEEIRQGFAEFRWWAPRLRRLYETIEGEERMMQMLLKLENITPQTEEDRNKLEQQFEKT